MVKQRMVQTNIQIDDEKWQKLKAIAAAQRVPVAVLVREGLDRVLPLAEKQQDTVERWLASQEAESSG